jgi:hypothetical protein
VLVRVERLHTIEEIQFAFKKFYSHLPVYTSVQIKKYLINDSYSKTCRRYNAAALNKSQH